MTKNVRAPLLKATFLFFVQRSAQINAAVTYQGGWSKQVNNLVFGLQLHREVEEVLQALLLVNACGHTACLFPRKLFAGAFDVFILYRTIVVMCGEQLVAVGDSGLWLWLMVGWLVGGGGCACAHNSQSNSLSKRHSIVRQERKKMCQKKKSKIFHSNDFLIATYSPI
jgi:hypothetical protein